LVNLISLKKIIRFKKKKKKKKKTSNDYHLLVYKKNLV